MRYLLDTNVVSEQSKPNPDVQVLQWLERQKVFETYLSIITICEIEQGIQLLGNTKRARVLEIWLEKLEFEFTDHVLGITRDVAKTWAEATAKAIKAGQTLSYADSLIVATAITHDLTIVTRNTSDFSSVTKKLINPWLE
jgi:toxin FitB